MAGTVRAAGFGTDASYVRTANENVCAIVQIESSLAVDNAVEIASVEGVGCLFLGPSDLSASLGVPRDSSHPTMREAIRSVVAAAQGANKAVGAFCVSVEEAEDYRKLGVNFIALQSDISWLMRGASSARRQLISPSSTA